MSDQSDERRLSQNPKLDPLEKVLDLADFVALGEENFSFQGNFGARMSHQSDERRLSQNPKLDPLENVFDPADFVAHAKENLDFRAILGFGCRKLQIQSDSVRTQIGSPGESIRPFGFRDPWLLDPSDFVTPCQLSIVSYCQLSVISCQLSIVSCCQLLRCYVVKLF